MAEAKLGLYQLAAAGVIPTRTGSAPSVYKPSISTPSISVGSNTTTPKTNIFQKHNITFDSVLGRIEQLFGIAGGLANVINAFKPGQPMKIGGETLDPQQAQVLYQAAVANQQAGGGQAGQEAMMRMMEQNQQMMQMFIMANSNNNKGNETKDNTMLYVGLGIAVVLGLGVFAVVMSRK